MAATPGPRHRRGHEVRLPEGHVYHVVMSVPKADGELGDGVWRALVDEAIEHMGFGPDAKGVGGCRWVAVHHGLSVEGNDHVHVVINLVRGDGRIANTYRDWPRWRSWCLAVEERLDLTRTAPAGAGRKATSRAELERATKAGTRTDRQRLTQLVAEAAARSDSEIDFLAHLQQANVRFRPRMSDDKVVGYTVALETEQESTEPLWFAGSTLRRDLSLPRLRARWEQLGPLWETAAAVYWTGERDVDLGEVTATNMAWRQVTRHLKEAAAVLGEEVADDRDRWSQTTGETADLVAVLAHFDHDHDHLNRVADQLARAAQLERDQGRPRPREPGVAVPFLVAAARAAAACKDPAPLVLAAALLLIWSIVKILQRAAEPRQLRLRASALQQIAAAADGITDHPALRTADNRRSDTQVAPRMRRADPAQGPERHPVVRRPSSSPERRTRTR
jgi:hypothetical protein